MALLEVRNIEKHFGNVDVLSGIDFDLKEAEVCHTESGAPYYRLSGSLKNRVGNNRLFLSISHDGGMAAAVCLIEGESET